MLAEAACPSLRYLSKTRSLHAHFIQHAASACRVFFHIPTDVVVAQEASDVESNSHLDFLWLHNLPRRFIA